MGWGNAWEGSLDRRTNGTKETDETEVGLPAGGTRWAMVTVMMVIVIDDGVDGDGGIEN